MAAGVSERGKVAILSFCLLCCSLLLTAYSTRHPALARTGTALLSEAVAPLYALVDITHDSVRSLWGRYFYLVGVSNDNEALRVRLSELEGARGALMEHQLENTRLRSLLDLGSVRELRGVVAEVIGDEPSGWGQGVVINKGSSSGIRVGMAVVHPKGVVGQVVVVSSNFAQILLLTDHSSGVDAVVQDSRVRGVVEGIGASHCELKYVAKQSPVRIGEVVVTSGMDGVFPKGLIVGTITKVAVETGTLLQNLELKVAVDLRKLEEVLVITGEPDREQRVDEAKALGKADKARGLK